MLKYIEYFDEIHDLGCGLGHYLALIKGHIGIKNSRCVGYYIYETAFVRAK